MGVSACHYLYLLRWPIMSLEKPLSRTRGGGFSLGGLIAWIDALRAQVSIEIGSMIPYPSAYSDVCGAAVEMPPLGELFHGT